MLQNESLKLNRRFWGRRPRRGSFGFLSDFAVVKVPSFVDSSSKRFNSESRLNESLKLRLRERPGRQSRFADGSALDRTMEDGEGEE